jgi:hypothetical protein
MARWFSRWKKSNTAEPPPGSRRSKRPPASRSSRNTKGARRRHPAPPTWTDPDQDFITRYGDPFDG